jgi:choline kinase
LKCVVIAAGRGSRFQGTRESKPLTPVRGRPLIEWVIRGARQAGLDEFLVVTGYAREKLEPYLEQLKRDLNVPIATLYNDQWEKENGLSVYRARGSAGDKFALLMSDHIFDPAILTRLLAQSLAADETMLAVDSRLAGHPTVDLDDVTRVLVEDGRIARIGKGLDVYNAFDTGIFLCTSALFRALEEGQRRGDSSLSGGLRVLVESRKARVMDVGDGFWIDVDDENALARAERLIEAGSIHVP